MLIGSHVSKISLKNNQLHPKIEVAQIFLSSNRSYKSPKIEVWAPLAVPTYIHAPYLLNPSSSNPEVREKTAVSLQGQVDAAHAIGASGVVVHAGHCSGGTIQDAVEGWKEVLSQVHLSVPVLIENMAGGKASPGRTLDGWNQLWDGVGSNPMVGVCLDTCHAWAGGLSLDTLAEDIRRITGRIDLVHANGSLDAFGSGRDHHAPIFDSDVMGDAILDFIEDADAPVILETPRFTIEEIALLKLSVHSRDTGIK